MKFPMGCAITEHRSMGLGATWDAYCTGTCEKECAQACDPASSRYDATRCAACKKLYPDYRAKAGIGAAASLIAGSQPVYGGAYAPAASGLPSWLLPVGIGVGVIALVLAMRRGS